MRPEGSSPSRSGSCSGRRVRATAARGARASNLCPRSGPRTVTGIQVSAAAETSRVQCTGRGVSTGDPATEWARATVTHGCARSTCRAQAGSSPPPRGRSEPVHCISSRSWAPGSRPPSAASEPTSRRGPPCGSSLGRGTRGRAATVTAGSWGGRDRLTVPTLPRPHRPGHGLSVPTTRDQRLNASGCGPGIAV